MINHFPVGRFLNVVRDDFTKAELKFLIKCADKDDNGKMDCSEFVLMMAALVSGLV